MTAGEGAGGLGARDAARFPHGAVASPHALASEAGRRVLAGGGNAIDAAIATNLALAVVAPHHCGFGGDLFALVWDGGRLHAYNGSGRAPAAATPEAVRIAAGGAGTMPERGPLPVTVPGAVEAWFALLAAFGTRPFGELASAALAHARGGFALTPGGAAAIADSAAEFREGEPAFAEWRRTYAGARAGETLRQPGLARTLEALAGGGPDALYRGPIAAAIAEAVGAAGGLLAAGDLAAHAGEWVAPMSVPFGDLEVVELPPNTQGVTALEALAIVGDPALLPPEGPERQHLLIEAAKLALADRRHVTDPAHMRVDPATLASPAWAAARRALIDPARAGRPESGRPATGGTAYLCAADADGMLVSLIQSNYEGFGSGITVPGWGINLHNRGAFFSLDTADANVIAPGKRTMHTLIPAMALREGRPRLVFGTMGGDGQAQTHLQLLARIVADGLDPQRAIDAPRWVVSPQDVSVLAESRFAPEVLEGLRARGHDLAVGGPLEQDMGHAHAILVEQDGYAAATDPRAEGAALGI